MTKKKITTIESLARMVADGFAMTATKVEMKSGFAEVDRGFDEVNKRLDEVNDRLEKIENVLYRNHEERIQRLENMAFGINSKKT